MLSLTAWNRSDRWSKLRVIAGAAAGILFCEVMYSILSEYRWYFPPDFDKSAFLGGRRYTFIGIYPMAFYAHLVSGPLSVIMGVFLMFTGGTKRIRQYHRAAGKLQIGLVLLGVVPSGVIMAQQAYGGLISILGFSLLSIATGFCAVMAGYFAATRKFQSHQRWATRCFILLASPLLLRLIGGAVIVMDLESELAYRLNAWFSWLLPIAIHEFVLRYATKTRRRPELHLKWFDQPSEVEKPNERPC